MLNDTNLRRDPRTGAGGVVYIDTDAEDRGPELAFVGGYFEGTDYQSPDDRGLRPPAVEGARHRVLPDDPRLHQGADPHEDLPRGAR